MLTIQDIDTIRNTVIDVIDPRLLANEEKIDSKLVAMESRLEKNIDAKLDEKIGELALITKHGFDEVHARLDSIDSRLDNIEHHLERVEEIVLPAAGYSISAA